MKIRRIVNGDVVFGHGLADFAVGDDATVQAVKCELRFQRGEWFLDITKGIPWLRHANTDERPILGRFPADLSYAAATIKATILSVDGVASIDTFDLDFNHATRALSCTAKGTLKTGEPFTLTEPAR